jgi:hypothetical protein
MLMFLQFWFYPWLPKIWWSHHRYRRQKHKDYLKSHRPSWWYLSVPYSYYWSLILLFCKGVLHYLSSRYKCKPLLRLILIHKPQKFNWPQQTQVSRCICFGGSLSTSEHIQDLEILSSPTAPVLVSWSSEGDISHRLLSPFPSQYRQIC